MTKSHDRSADNDGALNDLISKLRQANAHLVIATMRAQELQAAAEATNVRQEVFLGMLAHELRNPLAPVAMAGEILGTITSAHTLLPKLHNVISRQTNHMIRLVDDLLDASRINSGKITLRRSILPFSEVIESAIETSQPFLDKQQQQLTLDNDDESILIDGDLVRLSQVFSNLLINAAKFTPRHGRIAVSVRTLDDLLCVSVRDNGMGIPFEAQASIFDLFIQGSPPLDGALGGLGIGLSLARTIVQLHGGTIKVQSEGAGTGSEFVVLLPISPHLIPLLTRDPLQTTASENLINIIPVIKPH